MKKNTTKETDAISNLHLVGNIIPPQWYKSIMKNATEKGKVKPKAHLLAINILADIVYWYKNTVERDELSGEVIEIRKKFKGDLLQRSYASIMEMFSCSMEDARESIVFLENLGLIKRVFRTEIIGDVKVGNLMFIQIFPNMVAKATNQTTPLQMVKPQPKKEVKKAVKQEIPTPEKDNSFGSNDNIPISEMEDTLLVISPTPPPEMTRYTYITTDTTTENTPIGGDTPPAEIKSEVVVEEIDKEDDEISQDEKYEQEVKEELMKLIMSSSMQKEKYLMDFKTRVKDATMEDVEILAIKVVNDTFIGLMRAEYLDTAEKVLKHVKSSQKNRVAILARGKMQSYCSSQKTRLVNNFQNTVTIPPPLSVKAEVIDRSDINSEHYSPYFDPNSELYISDPIRREQAYNISNKQANIWFHNRQ